MMIYLKGGEKILALQCFGMNDMGKSDMWERRRTAEAQKDLG